MIKQSAYLALTTMFLLTTAMYGDSMTPAKSAASKDSSTREQPPELLTVSPRLLYGVWQGMDSAGRKVSFSFKDIKEGQPGIFNMVIKIGKLRLAGTCTDWENNTCDLILNTEPIQNILSKWAFRYDGSWLAITICTSDLIAGSKSFTLKKVEYN